MIRRLSALLSAAVLAYACVAAPPPMPVPEWWNDRYGLHGVPGHADSDGDGLSNYAEYLLSEVYDVGGLQFDPTDPDSVVPGMPDYFVPIGRLYAGEIFTDHDQVDDTWEDLFDADFASRLKFDASKDADEDGWCNRSEVRYTKACMQADPDRQYRYVAGSSVPVADYPIPTLELRIRYNGRRASAVATAGINVEVRSSGDFSKPADAVYRFAPVESGGEPGEPSGRVLGRWRGRRVVGTLTPGNVRPGSLALGFRYDPTDLDRFWVRKETGPGAGSFMRVTQSELDALRLRFPESVRPVPPDGDYSALDDLELGVDAQSLVATWSHTRTGRVLGTVDLVTGDFDLDMGVFSNQYAELPAEDGVRPSLLEDQTYRIAYSASLKPGLPRTLYLGEATDGHVREGRNTVTAWADLDGGTDGVWDPGEPFGVVSGVDVSWRKAVVEMEISDMSAVYDRMRIGDSGASESSRKVFYGEGDDSGTVDMPDAPPVEVNVVSRIRVVPYMVRGTKQEQATAPEMQAFVPIYAYVTNRVVASFDVSAPTGRVIHEGQFLGDGEFDIDWDGFFGEIRLNNALIEAVGDVTAVRYRMVVGDKGPIGPASYSDTNTVVKALPTLVTRFFESEAGRTRPAVVSPGGSSGGTVTEASPTFVWRLDESSTVAGRFGCSYPAFEILVKTNGVVVYDSGLQRTPPRNGDGSFSWKPPVCVGDRLPDGGVFANGKAYTWEVSMFNSKFRDELYSEPSSFYMNVPESGYSTRNVPVAVRYFGPVTGGVVRVQAFASPDFTGRPEGSGYVPDLSQVTNLYQTVTNVYQTVTNVYQTVTNLDQTVTNVYQTVTNVHQTVTNLYRSVVSNATIIGLAKGTYYLLAFIDTNGNGKCDRWETSGYLCSRDGSEGGLSPAGYRVDGQDVLAVIYLDDADTDGDAIPDALEYVTWGGLDARGPATLVTTPVGGFPINTEVMPNLTARPSGVLGGPAGGVADGKKEETR